MRTALGIACLALMVVVGTGCVSQPPRGTWQMVSIEPESARGQFAFGSITFEADGKYVADANYGGETKPLAGTFELDAAHEVITFKDAGGAARSYRIKYCNGCSTMQMWNDGPERRWEAKLKRTQ